MSRETLAIFEQQLETFLARHAEVEGERAALAARLASVERAYEDLLRRVQRYEGERLEIRARLERLLSRLGLSGAA
jgi:septal ring factor EnvC (AmiA/AmiB activator)